MSIFMILAMVACSTTPVSNSQATRSPSASACTATCVMEDDTMLVNFFSTSAKNFGRISATSFEELFRKCNDLVKTAINNNEVPYSLPRHVLSTETLFSPRLYNNLVTVRNGSYEEIHLRSLRANSENSCK